MNVIKNVEKGRMKILIILRIRATFVNCSVLNVHYLNDLHQCSRHLNILHSQMFNQSV